MGRIDSFLAGVVVFLGCLLVAAVRQGSLGVDAVALGLAGGVLAIVVVARLGPVRDRRAS